MTTITSNWLTGNFGPVTEEVTAVDLAVTGTIPDGLDGRYLRNGPNPRGEVDPASYHWFTGDGMVHGVRLRDGRAEWYRNRWVTDGGRSGPTPTSSATPGAPGPSSSPAPPPVELTDELESARVQRLRRDAGARATRPTRSWTR